MFVDAYENKSIPTAFVNDGFCDCCDGSDEYLSTQCVNTCGMMSIGKFRFYPLNAAMFTFSFGAIGLITWYFGLDAKLVQISLSMKKSQRHKL